MYLETERMILKEYELGDHDLMFNLDSDPEVVKHVGGKQNDYELYIKAIDRYLKQYKEFNGFGYYKVYLKENPTEDMNIDIEKLADNKLSVFMNPGWGYTSPKQMNDEARTNYRPPRSPRIPPDFL